MQDFGTSMIVTKAQAHRIAEALWGFQSELYDPEVGVEISGRLEDLIQRKIGRKITGPKNLAKIREALFFALSQEKGLPTGGPYRLW